ncbi:hypothetical protein ACWEPZ_37730 [Streptomyces sp. NPDC004288]|uniref:hypothetical protein n=1 Tax=Streptomyces sp. NPDC005574 TaxID=3156891 RepID=UPI0033AC294C
MSALIPQPCGYVSGAHDGPTRYYACGWRCATHALTAHRRVSADDHAEPATPVVAIRAAIEPAGGEGLDLQVRDALFIDLGEGYEIKKDGPRKGQIWWKRDPRARYECLPCQYASPVVHGADEVRAFVATIRTDHRAICPGRPAQPTEGAAAA